MKSILIVEDNDLNMELLSTLLEGEGFNTVCAANGEQALVRVQENIPDLVLMDIQMPVLDGYQTMKCFRELQSMIDVPVVAVTGNAMIHDREKILAEGFHNVLTKPFSIKSVLEMVRSLLTVPT